MLFRHDTQDTSPGFEANLTFPAWPEHHLAKLIRRRKIHDVISILILEHDNVEHRVDRLVEKVTKHRRQGILSIFDCRNEQGFRFRAIGWCFAELRHRFTDQGHLPTGVFEFRRFSLYVEGPGKIEWITDIEIGKCAAARTQELARLGVDELGADVDIVTALANLELVEQLRHRKRAAKDSASLLVRREDILEITAIFVTTPVAENAERIGNLDALRELDLGLVPFDDNASLVFVSILVTIGIDGEGRITASGFPLGLQLLPFGTEVLSFTGGRPLGHAPRRKQCRRGVAHAGDDLPLDLALGNDRTRLFHDDLVLARRKIGNNIREGRPAAIRRRVGPRIENKTRFRVTAVFRGRPLLVDRAGAALEQSAFVDKRYRTDATIAHGIGQLNREISLLRIAILVRRHLPHRGHIHQTDIGAQRIVLLAAGTAIGRFALYPDAIRHDLDMGNIDTVETGKIFLIEEAEKLHQPRIVSRRVVCHRVEVDRVVELDLCSLVAAIVVTGGFHLHYGCKLFTRLVFIDLRHELVRDKDSENDALGHRKLGSRRYRSSTPLFSGESHRYGTRNLRQPLLLVLIKRTGCLFLLQIIYSAQQAG